MRAIHWFRSDLRLRDNTALAAVAARADEVALVFVLDDRLLQGPRVGPPRLRFLWDAIGRLSEAPIYIDDTPLLRVVEMRSKTRRLFYERGVDLIIVDYLQLMQGDRRSDNRVQEVSEISRSLKALAREINAPVLAVSQLSRAPEGRASHEPQLSDLRESGSIEQDADVVVFVYRDEYYYPSKEDWEREHPGESYPPPADIIIAKHRNGPTGVVKLLFKPRMAKVENIPNQEPSLL